MAPPAPQQREPVARVVAQIYGECQQGFQPAATPSQVDDRGDAPPSERTAVLFRRLQNAVGDARAALVRAVGVERALDLANEVMTAAGQLLVVDEVQREALRRMGELQTLFVRAISAANRIDETIAAADDGMSQPAGRADAPDQAPAPEGAYESALSQAGAASAPAATAGRAAPPEQAGADVATAPPTAEDRAPEACPRPRTPDSPTPLTVWYHGGLSYSTDGRTRPIKVSREEHNTLQAFLDHDEARDTKDLEKAGVSNVAAVIDKLARKFGAAVQRPQSKGEGYFIRVRSSKRATPTG